MDWKHMEISGRGFHFSALFRHLPGWTVEIHEKHQLGWSRPKFERDVANISQMQSAKETCGGVDVYLHHSRPRHCMEVSGQPHAPVALIPGKDLRVFIVLEAG
jgi:hypothetical protein